MLKKSSPLKQLDQMEPNLAGSIYVRSKPGIDGPWVQTWGQLLSNVIYYITITLQFSWLHYITITSVFKCNRLNYNHFVNVIDYITDYI
jgi:hypothetical protein